MRALEAEHLLELEDACVAQRDAQGKLHLKQAIGGRIEDALPGHFWHQLIHHILRHGSQQQADPAPTPHYGLTREFGLASLITASRVSRIAPVSREMILNYVSHQTLGLPKSY